MSQLFDKNTRFTPLVNNERQKEDAHVITQANFICKNCGSDLVYSPTSQDLHCRNCGNHYPVKTSEEPIHEYDFKQAIHELARLRHDSPSDKRISVIHCPSCGADFSFKKTEHAGECPYCATPVIAGSAEARFIIPRSLLPFSIEKNELFQFLMHG